MGQGAVTFFLAHAGRDTERAKELWSHLHPDVSVFLDAVDLVPGDQWDVALVQRQRQALATVALLSSGTDAAYYLRTEIANAIAFQRQEPDKHRLIPVFLDGVPKDPAQVPYGIRGLHSLDMSQLGVDGVATELRRTAARLSGTTPPEPSPATPGPVDRMEMFDRLCKLLPSQFEEVLFRVGAPRQHLAPPSEPLARRALDLVQWAEQEGESRLTALRRALRTTAGPA